MRFTHGCVLAAFLPLHSACCFAFGSVWAWAASLASPWAKDLDCMSCPVPGGQLS